MVRLGEVKEVMNLFNGSSWFARVRGNNILLSISGPKGGDYCIAITKQQQQQLSVAENGEVGDKVLHQNMSAPCTPGVSS